MTHGSLFSGIGGFDLAAQRVGWKNIFQVEIEEKACKILQKHFPDTQRYADIKDFDGRQYAGHIDIISGGFPCQPFSAAGKRKGSADDRAIWFEMFRVVSEIRPRWVVAENVSGLLTIEQGMAFERVCTDLESEGYTVQSFVIPACAVGAPHRRNRVWIVAYSNLHKHGKDRTRTNKTERVPGVYWQKNSSAGQFSGANEYNITQDTNSGADGRIATERRQEQHRHTGATDEIRTSPNTNNRRQTEQEQQTARCEQYNCTSPNTVGGRLQESRRMQLLNTKHNIQHNMQPFWRRTWFEVATELCRVDDGIPGRLDRLKHLGNAIVPQVAQAIFSAINEYEGIEI